MDVRSAARESDRRLRRMKLYATLYAKLGHSQAVTVPASRRHGYALQVVPMLMTKTVHSKLGQQYRASPSQLMSMQTKHSCHNKNVRKMQ